MENKVMYIVAISEAGFKLVRDLPEVECCFNFSKSYPCDGNNEHAINGYCTCYEQFEIRQQAISDAPFVKNIEVVNELLKMVGGRPRRSKIRNKPPYKVDLSDYEVSEPFEEHCTISGCGLHHDHEHEFVIITKKEDKAQNESQDEEVNVNRELVLK